MESTEIDAEYYLDVATSEQLEIADALDPKRTGEFFAMKNEFFGKTPGLHSRFALHSVNAEVNRYLQPLLALPNG